MNKKVKTIYILEVFSLLTFFADLVYTAGSFEFVPIYLVLFIAMQLVILFLIFKYYPSKFRIIGAGVTSVITLSLFIFNYIYIPSPAINGNIAVELDNTSMGTINFEEIFQVKTPQEKDEYIDKVSSQVKAYLTSGSSEVKAPATYDSTNPSETEKNWYRGYFPASIGSNIRIVSSTEKNGSIYAHIVTHGTYDETIDMKSFNPEAPNCMGNNGCFRYMNVELIIRTDKEGNILSEKIIDVNTSTTRSKYLPLQYFDFIPSNSDKVYIIYGVESGDEADKTYLYNDYIGYLDDDLNVMEQVTLQTLPSLYLSETNEIIVTNDLAIIDDIVYILDQTNHHLVKFNLKDGNIEKKEYREKLEDKLWQHKESLASDGDLLFTIDMISQGEEQTWFHKADYNQPQTYPTYYQLSIYDKDFNYQESIVFNVLENELMFNNIYDFQDIKITEKDGKYQLSTPQITIDIEKTNAKIGYNSIGGSYQIMDYDRESYFKHFSTIPKLDYLPIATLILLPITLFLSLTLVSTMEDKNEEAI